MTVPSNVEVVAFPEDFRRKWRKKLFAANFCFGRFRSKIIVHFFSFAAKNNDGLKLEFFLIDFFNGKPSIVL